MRDEILDIVKKIYHNHLTIETGTDLLLGLFNVVGQSEQLFKLRDNCVNGVDDEVCRNSGICKYCS